MIEICIFPNCNRDTDDYDVIEPKNSTLLVATPIKSLYLLVKVNIKKTCVKKDCEKLRQLVC